MTHSLRLVILAVLVAAVRTPAQKAKPLAFPVKPAAWRADVPRDGDSVVAPEDVALLEIHDTKRLGEPASLRGVAVSGAVLKRPG